MESTCIDKTKKIQRNVHSSHTILECVCINNLSVLVSPWFLHFGFACRLRYLQFVVFQALMKRLQNSPVDLVAKLGAALCQIPLGGPRWQCNRMRGLTKG